MNLRPKYTQKPIGSIEALANLLNLTLHDLDKLIQSSNDDYIVADKIEKDDGSIRVTYKAKPRLRTALDSIKSRVFDKVEHPDYITAGQIGKSYVDNAQAHINSRMLMSEDIRNFFPSISVKEVNRIFQHFFCFPPKVSNALSELSTKEGFLVQGSPLSGEIANLIFYRDEPELVKFCQDQGLRYTRYYDDIHISSDEKDFYELIPHLKSEIYRIFGKSGVKPHRAKKKSHFSTCSSRLSVHDVTVNSKKTNPSQKRISKVRQLLFTYEYMVDNNCDIEDIIKKYRSIHGHINTLQQQGYSQAGKLKEHLSLITCRISESEAKKYARKYRKVKSKKELTQFSSKVSILKRISGRVAMVINSEKKSANDKIKKKLSRNSSM
ncbi:TPA: RNA-directed DNA polymerase [Vibrio parahaemolyticus]|uniref:reverse transcriptase family protein n=1 Tax=Vibrio parahaemolyticus TaxID=670 RepID=UPI0010AA3FC9|nr:reverse transcriptase family protein [Vibrio parahaemolyticus]ELK8486985.1 RNA-directed DNA polymerase [Vibrio parahaemolyticus]MBE3848448.1 RNA-directed DNA polymerase [Vibrio parahaemolyticus]MBM4882228.1 RNA-directed DNA polymerase [Vibrio parahaemolyticus]THE59702.1 RNA-directed DNA polymerase [Vibrio parahaemolyticus]HCE3230996.1 RNA-directed DNA polymerase [Vibrio parahaemolyticus]